MNDNLELGQYQITTDQMAKLNDWKDVDVQEINEQVLPNAYNHLYSVGWMQPVHLTGMSR
jgi:hypothetical protein